MNRHLLSHDQRTVLDFHEKVDAYTGDWPHIPPEFIRKLRVTLIEEELEEYKQASEDGDIVEIADAIADLLYVINGAALAWGIAMGPINAEVQRSNMTKGGGQLREDTKVIKGPNFDPPRLEPLLEAQIPDESR
jgi:predicted HAD superfamily Cof-like phosphohydrolase